LIIEYFHFNRGVQNRTNPIE